jgi:hypothetical protein
MEHLISGLGPRLMPRNHKPRHNCRFPNIRTKLMQLFLYMKYIVEKMPYLSRHVALNMMTVRSRSCTPRELSDLGRNNRTGMWPSLLAARGSISRCFMRLPYHDDNWVPCIPLCPFKRLAAQSLQTHPLLSPPFLPSLRQVGRVCASPLSNAVA